MKKTFLVFAILLCTLIAFSIPSMAAAPTYLFITSGTDVTIDETLIARIKSLGFDVVVKNHDGFDAVADSADKIAIYISESVASANIVEKFNNIAVPLIISEAYIFDDMGLTAPTADVDFGSNTANIKGKVVKPDHPIMKGVSADYAVVTRDLDPLPNYTWGVVPEKNALAVEPDNASHAVVFAFDKGESSADSLWPSYKFPEKRAAINFHTSMVIDAVSDDMWKIFDNAIIWAAGVNPLAPPEVETVTTTEAVSATGEAENVNPKTLDLSIFMITLAGISTCGIFYLKKKIK